MEEAENFETGCGNLTLHLKNTKFDLFLFDFLRCFSSTCGIIHFFSIMSDVNEIVMGLLFGMFTVL